MFAVCDAGQNLVVYYRFDFCLCFICGQVLRGRDCAQMSIVCEDRVVAGNELREHLNALIPDLI